MFCKLPLTLGAAKNVSQFIMALKTIRELHPVNKLVFLTLNNFTKFKTQGTTELKMILRIL
jgi:hypothetical protein